MLADFSNYRLLHDLSDPKVLREWYNISLDDIWYFAPKIMGSYVEKSYPNPVVICLILTNPFRESRPKEWSNQVLYINC